MKKEQKQVDEWVKQYKIGYFSPFECLACLTEEMGEVAKEINHLYGPKKKKKSEGIGNLGDEIADVIVALCCLANSQNIDLDKHFQKVMDKYHYRDNNRWEKK